MLRTALCAVAAAVLLSSLPAEAGRDGAWPAGLEGPFAAQPTEQIELRSHDGTVLRGWLTRPLLPAGVGAPTVLYSSPYDGTLDAGAEDTGPTAVGGRAVPVPVQRLLEAGYAVANVNVRGTGRSGGCFELFGPRERRDQAVLVDWLAAQPWSNGRVGMMGISYDGTTALEAAAEAPEALRAIAVSGISPDLYETFYSPQGGVYDDQWPAIGGFYAPVTALPRRGSGDLSAAALVEAVGARPERLCPALVEWVRETSTGALADSRDRAFWEDRNLVPALRSARTAVLLLHGLQDHVAFGEDYLPSTMRKAPMTYVAGQWIHTFPTDEDRPGLDAQLLAFFDAHLKDRGRFATGVEFQDDRGTWRSSRSWPPAEARTRDHDLRTGSFRAVPDSGTAGLSLSPRDRLVPYPPPCGVEDGVTSLVTSLPVDRATVVAGNPTASLRVSSDQASGRFSLRLYELASGASCESARFLTEGTADLRFLEDRYAAKDLVPGVPVDVELSLQNLAEHLDAGSTLLAVVGLGPQKVAHVTAPVLTVHSASLHLPVL